MFFLFKISSKYPSVELVKLTPVRKWYFTCNSIPTADNPHMTIISDEYEPTADTHVQAGYNHDTPRDNTPHQ